MKIHFVLATAKEVKVSIRGIFTRKGEERIITKMFGNKIICDNSQLKKHVTSWAENEGWKFEEILMHYYRDTDITYLYR